MAAAGKSILLGSDDIYAKKDEETPRPKASFSQDFWIDSTEVTQAEYTRLMGRNPAEPRFGKADGDPVYNVSWYDAAAYCNARSRAQGLDTVYAYAFAQTDSSGRIFALQGLAVHYDRKGYRLPTEAEWEFAARGGAVSTFPWGDAPDSAAAGRTAWYAGDAEGQAHPVDGLQANAYGLSDMLGNVMEWTGDWKGPYAAVSLRDFLGAREPGAVPERVVKGGAFAYDMRYLRFSGRSANYPTFSSAAAEYLGFRCALGPIASGQYLQEGQAHGVTPVITPNAAGAASLSKGRGVKLVCVNATSATRTLAYVDFSESPDVVHEFLDDGAVFTPVISPDGEWVAYGNVDEGGIQAGKVRIRRLKPGSAIQDLSVGAAAIPRWWVDPASRDTFLIYATTARDDAEAAWASDQTLRVRIAGGRAVGRPQLVAQGGYHDGLSSDGVWLATGFRRLKTKNLATGTERLLFVGPANGKPPGDTSQVCNVSLSPDFARAPHILLLDFGDADRSAVVGRAYGLHEILFRMDTSGQVRRWYGAPSGFAAWQDVEWSNHPDYAVAVGETQGGDYPAVIAAGLADSTTIELARGDDLRQPGLWFRPSDTIPGNSAPGVADSLGRYDDPPQGFEQAEFAAKLRILWLRRDSVEVACLGSSHVKSGIRPDAFAHFRTLNLGYSAGGFLGTGEILRHYVLPHCPRLRAVIYEVVPGWLFDQGGDYTWRAQMGATLGYRYDGAHGFWSAAVPIYMDSVMRLRTVTTTETYDDAGGSTYAANGWGADPPPVYPQGTGMLPDSAVSDNLAALSELVRQSDALGILFVMTLMPESSAYRNTPDYGKYGPSWAAGRALVAQLKAICAGFPHCRFYDANLEGGHDYDSAMAINEDHLATPGAMRLSRRLDSALAVWTGAPAQ